MMIPNTGGRGAARPFLSVLAAVSAVASLALGARAQVTTLAAENSSVTINNSGPSAGIANWTVDGVNFLNPGSSGLQWFYYSFSGVNGDKAQGIDQLGLASISAVTQTANSSAFATTYGV